MPPQRSRAASRSPSKPSGLESADIATRAAPTRTAPPKRLVDQLGEIDLLPPAEQARFDPPDVMRARQARLPGSADRIVGRFEPRREITPEDVVNAVAGMLFGGNYNPCPDLRAKVHHATLLHPEQYAGTERRDLVERERRCRYR